MRKIVSLFFFLLLGGMVVGCSNNPTQADEANGHTPTEIAVRYLTAEIENNTRRQMELATPALQESIIESKKEYEQYYSLYLLQFGPENKDQLDKNYQLEEFKLNDTAYFYRFSGAYKDGDMMKDRILKVALYKNDWKVDQVDAEVDFKENEANMKPVMIKEPDQEPLFLKQMAADYKEDINKGKQAESSHERFFTSEGEVLNGNSPADTALLYYVLSTKEDYLRLSKIITKEERDKLSNNFFPTDWTATKNKDDLEEAYQLFTKISDRIIEMKKDDSTYYYNMSAKFPFYYKVIKVNGEWKVQKEEVNYNENGAEESNAWDDLHERSVVPEFHIQ